MRYEVLVEPWAAACIEDAPREHLGEIYNRLDDLSLAPSMLSFPGPSPPYPPGHQAFEFYISDSDGTLHKYAALFKYLSDERHIIIAYFFHFEDS